MVDDGLHLVLSSTHGRLLPLKREARWRLAWATQRQRQSSAIPIRVNEPWRGLSQGVIDLTGLNHISIYLANTLKRNGLGPIALDEALHFADSTRPSRRGLGKHTCNQRVQKGELLIDVLNQPVLGPVWHGASEHFIKD